MMVSFLVLVLLLALVEVGLVGFGCCNEGIRGTTSSRPLVPFLLDGFFGYNMRVVERMGIETGMEDIVGRMDVLTVEFSCIA
jgi:hypothetical protein